LNLHVRLVALTLSLWTLGSELAKLTLWRPLLPYGYSYCIIKHPVPDWVKPSFHSFVIFDVRTLWRASGLSVRVPECQKLQLTA